MPQSTRAPGCSLSTELELGWEITMTPRERATSIFDCGLFLCDPRSALAQAKHATGSQPMFPQSEWHQALRRCVERDNSRRLVAYFKQLDSYRIQIQYRERIEGDGISKMNGEPLHLCAAEELPDVRGISAWNERHTGPGWGPLRLKAAKAG